MVVLELRPAHDSAASRRVQLELENEEDTCTKCLHRQVEHLVTDWTNLH